MICAGRFHRMLLARRLKNFRDRIGEVPAEAHEEMSFAVAELTANVLGLVGDKEDCHGRSAEENLDRAVQALEGSQPLVAGEYNKHTLDDIGIAVREMFQALKAAKLNSK